MQSKSIHELAYVGWNGRLLYRGLMAAPAAPRNYGPDAARTYVERRSDEILETGAITPGLASLAQVVILDGRGQEMLDSSTTEPGVVAADFLDWLLNYTAARRHDGVAQDPRKICGFRLHNLVEIACADLILSTIDEGPRILPHWLIGDSGERDDYVLDLYDHPLFSRTMNTSQVLGHLVGEFWQLPEFIGAPVQAVMVRRLALMLRLAPQDEGS